ncbi:MAG: Ldh family oxidoreductase [Candidatus Planktophila sp.]|jgi:(2R)-3-sulfolactate dehydrogenase (NADP+)|nr:Ldh family oxidoreductase [Candidatus Planktophila sp.]
MTQLTVGAAITKATELLVAAGMDSAKAATSAHAIVASDRWGIGSHGLMRLPFYLDRLKAGGINPKAELKKVTDMPGLVIFDGEDGLGHWQIQHAAQLAAERAKINGIAAVGVGRSSHCGALGIYVWPMIDAGLVGIAFSTGPAVMPPTGGNKPLLSTSPVAAGIPTNPPTVVDLATSAVARGKIQAKAQAGAELEPGWAFTKDGAPTIDAKEALAGMLAPLGGAKGYALAVLVESLTGVLIGPTLSKNIPDMFNHDFDSAPQEIAHFVIAIDASKLSVDGENNRLADFAGEVSTAGGRLPGSNRVNPGKLNLSDEITITDSVAAQLGL